MGSDIIPEGLPTIESYKEESLKSLVRIEYSKRKGESFYSKLETQALLELQSKKFCELEQILKPKTSPFSSFYILSMIDDLLKVREFHDEDYLSENSFVFSRKRKEYLSKLQKDYDKYESVFLGQYFNDWLDIESPNHWFNPSSSIYENEKLRLKALREEADHFEYCNSIDIDNFMIKSGLSFGRISNLLIDPKEELGKQAISKILYHEFNDEIANSYFYHVDCYKPTSILRLFNLFRKEGLIEIDEQDLPKLVRILFNIPSKYHAKYSLEIPSIRGISSMFGNDLKAALRLMKDLEMFVGKTNHLALMVKKVFPVPGLSQRSIENCFKPSSKINFNVLNRAQVMGVLDF